MANHEFVDAALFTGDGVHRREITLADGKKHALYFREIVSADFRKLQTTSAKDEEYEQAVSRVIAASLCTPDGQDALTVEEAAKLKHGVRFAVTIAIAEVNGIGATVGKVLPPEEKSGSGTSSPSP